MNRNYDDYFEYIFFPIASAREFLFAVGIVVVAIVTLMPALLLPFILDLLLLLHNNNQQLTLSFISLLHIDVPRQTKII